MTGAENPERAPQLGQTWHAWLHAEIARYPSARAFAAALGVDPAQLSRWRRPYMQQPTPADVHRLASVTGTPLAEIVMLLFRALEERQRLIQRRSRVVSGLVVVVTSGWLAVAPPRVVGARPITAGPYPPVSATVLKDSVASRRRAA